MKRGTRNVNRAIHRNVRLYDMYLDERKKVRVVRRLIREQKKEKEYQRSNIYKYGIQVSRNVKEVIVIDEANENTFWQDVMKKKNSALQELDCWEFRKKGDLHGNDYQPTTLHMVFDVKQDLHRKDRLVAGGHLVELFDNYMYASNVKGISVKLINYKPSVVVLATHFQTLTRKRKFMRLLVLNLEKIWK